MRKRSSVIDIIGILALGFFQISCGGDSSTTLVVVPDFPEGEWSGGFSFYPWYGYTLYENNDFEIRYEGDTPPPSFEINVKSLDNKIHFYSPGLKVYVKYSYKDDWWGHTTYKVGWLCFPRNWADDTNYIVIILVEGREVASNRYYFRDRW